MEWHQLGLEGVKKILFFPHVPYHANTFISVIKELNDCEAVIVYADHLKHYESNKIKESNIKQYKLLPMKQMRHNNFCI